MNELQLVRELRGGTREPVADDLAPIRERLLAELTGPGAAVRRGHHRRVPRLAWLGASAAGLAAAVAAVLVLVPGSPGGQPARADAAAAHVLHLAATAAAGQPFTVPRPDQFIYRKEVTDGQTTERWLSVDDSRTSLVLTGANKQWLPGCKNGQTTIGVQGNFEGSRIAPCTPYPYYLPDLPVDANQMYAYLMKDSNGDANTMGKEVLYLTEHYLNPRQRAALFNAAANIPGLVLVGTVTTDAGRTGVAVSWSTSDGRQGEMVFDAKTYELIGFTTKGVPTDILTLTVKIVDEVGQRG